MGRRYRYRYRRGYSRRYRHYRKHRNMFHTLTRATRTADRLGWGVVKRVWRVADRAALSGVKLGFGVLRGVSYLVRR